MKQPSAISHEGIQRADCFKTAFFTHNLSASQVSGVAVLTGPWWSGHFENRKDRFWAPPCQSPNLSIWPVRPPGASGLSQDVPFFDEIPSEPILLLRSSWFNSLSFQPVPGHFLIDTYSGLLPTIYWPVEFLVPITENLLGNPSVPLLLNLGCGSFQRILGLTLWEAAYLECAAETVGDSICYLLDSPILSCLTFRILNKYIYIYTHWRSISVSIVTNIKRQTFGLKTRILTANTANIKGSFTDNISQLPICDGPQSTKYIECVEVNDSNGSILLGIVWINCVFKACVPEGPQASHKCTSAERLLCIG